MTKNIKILNLKDLAALNGEISQSKIIMCDHISSHQVLALYADNDIQHVIQQSNSDTASEVKLSTTMMTNPAQFIQYPLSMILGEQAPTKETELALSGVSMFLDTPEDKNKALNSLDQFLVKYTNSSSLSYDVRLASDELITNSIYNAPYIDSENKNLNPTRDQNKISIDPNYRPYFYAGCDGEQIVVGCKDFYGRLDVQKFINRIKTCYESNPGKMINYGEGGAGIGSFMVFDYCTRLYIVVDPGRLTSISCVFPLKLSAKARYDLPKNLHIANTESEA